MNKIKEIVNNLSQVSASTWTRLILLVVSMLNLALRSFGINTLPVENEIIADIVSAGFAAVSALAAYWKNNSFTSAALAADKALQACEQDALTDTEEIE